MKTLIDLPDQQVNALATICAAENVSRAEIIRRAISEFLSNNDRSEVDAFGIWQKSKSTEDGLQFQKKLRDEW